MSVIFVLSQLTGMVCLTCARGGRAARVVPCVCLACSCVLSNQDRRAVGLTLRIWRDGRTWNPHQSTLPPRRHHLVVFRTARGTGFGISSVASRSSMATTKRPSPRRMCIQLADVRTCRLGLAGARSRSRASLRLRCCGHGM